MAAQNQAFGTNVSFLAGTSDPRRISVLKSNKNCAILDSGGEELKIALVDDERIYLDEITRICREFAAENDIETEISVFSDGESFLSSLDGTGCGMVFMDIFMDGIDGVETVKKLRRLDSGCIVIFLTSCGERMPEAFSCHAFEYILKPFDDKRVKDVLADALKLLPASKYIDVCSGRKTARILLSDIVCAVSDAHYLRIALADGTELRCRMTAGEFAEQTAGDGRFISVNKGITVNAEMVTGFDNSCCLLENGARFPIRVRERLAVEQAVRDYNFEKIRSRVKLTRGG